jgi:hypothetical protein
MFKVRVFLMCKDYDFQLKNSRHSQKSKKMDKSLALTQQQLNNTTKYDEGLSHHDSNTEKANLTKKTQSYISILHNNNNINIQLHQPCSGIIKHQHPICRSRSVPEKAIELN